MSNRVSLNRTTSGPPLIVKALIAGVIFGAVGSLFAWLGKVLSGNPQPPPPADSLHGASSLAEMNRHAERLLAMGQDALSHDQTVLNQIAIIVGGLCLVSIIGAVAYIMKARRNPTPSTARSLAKAAMCVLAIVPFTVAVGVKITQGRILHGGTIVTGLENSTTSPRIVVPGQRVAIDIPTSLQSFFGYHTAQGISVKSCQAELSNGDRIKVDCGKPEMKNGGREPNRTDLIELMEIVEPCVSVTLPANPQLAGSLVTFCASGTVGIYPQGQRNRLSSRNFEGTTTFRVATENEARFSVDYDRVCTRLTPYLVTSIISAVVVILAVSVLVENTPAAKPDAKTGGETEAAASTSGAAEP